LALRWYGIGSMNLTAGTLRLQAGTGAPVLQDPAILQHLSGVFASYGNGVREAGGRLSRVRHLLQCSGVFTVRCLQCQEFGLHFSCIALTIGPCE